MLAAVDTSPLTVDVLLKVAELARRCDGEVVVLHVIQSDDAEIVIGKRGHRLWDNVLVGSVSQAVLEKSLIPVVV